MANPSEVVLQKGYLQGKLPGMRDWSVYYLEVTPSHLHIMDGQGDSTRGRKHLRSLEIDESDLAGEDTKNKKECRFYLLRSDGKYTFKCDSPPLKTDWITQLQRVIQRRSLESMDGFESPRADTFSPNSLSPPPSTPKHFEVPQVPRQKPSRNKSFSKNTVLDSPLPPTPGHMNSPRASVISTDSGFGASEGGEVKRHGKQHGFRSAPTSGDGRFARSVVSSSKSDGGKFDRAIVQVQDDSTEMNYDKCKWFWGTTSRQEAERRLLSEGKKGNFIVRINASGHYVMTYWRTDGVHHHKILNHGNIFRFEKSAVSAEGESLVDLLDTYMKLNNAKDKPIEPYGGTLYEQYNYAWTPPEFDMNLLESRLKEQKRLREEATKASQRPGQYTPIDLPSSKEDSGSGSYDSETQESPANSRRVKVKTLPSQKKRLTEDLDKKLSASTEEPIKAGKAKPLPPTPVKPKPKKSEQTSINPSPKGPGRPVQNLGGAALLKELKKSSGDQKKAPRPKPKPASKPSSTPVSPTHHTQPTPSTIDTSYEQPEYANYTFGPATAGTNKKETAVGNNKKETPQEIDDENVYMNVQAKPPPPGRRARGAQQQQQATSEYQNIGTSVARGKRRH